MPCLDDYDGVYLGDEVDNGTMPEPDLAMAKLESIIAVGKRAVVMTGYCKQADYQRTCDILDLLHKEHPGLEVVGNDLGIIYWLMMKGGFHINLGRLLVHQKCDPRWGGITDSVLQSSFERDIRAGNGNKLSLRYRPPESGFMRSLASCGSSGNAWSERLLKGGVTRVNLNNTSQGIISEYPEPWDISLHFPDVFITMLTPSTRATMPDSNIRSNGWLMLTHPSITQPLWWDGNAIYYRNDSMPDSISTLRVDRIIERLLPG